MHLVVRGKKDSGKKKKKTCADARHARHFFFFFFIWMQGDDVKLGLHDMIHESGTTILLGSRACVCGKTKRNWPIHPKKKKKRGHISLFMGQSSSLTFFFFFHARIFSIGWIFLFLMSHRGKKWNHRQQVLLEWDQSACSHFPKSPSTPLSTNSKCWPYMDDEACPCHKKKKKERERQTSFRVETNVQLETQLVYQSMGVLGD
ncbi:hypothetical protein BC940DRAFT_176827 [Gongronella butleri]|nr:hypothetical protein BC940DRAFT_176827 [Gongronella butleri]